ncbi:MAG: hypothetical protein NTX00_05820 [Candidatus Parcubacteria bacterium]|nr:hypothetical protein [Candidatus Parcubacteria bacterium]
MDNENCQKLYKKYVELKEKTAMDAHTMDSKKVKMQGLDQDALNELDTVREELINGNRLVSFSRDELIELSADDVLGPKTCEILSKMN